ncbi:MAG: DUF4271 domain-containing protein [Bacteroidaceae bacterium]
MMQDLNDSLSFSTEQHAASDSTVHVKHVKITPAQVLSWLPRNATPAEQDSAIQARFPPAEIHYSNQPDTLSTPGIRFTKTNLSELPSYKDGFFTSSGTLLHPECPLVQLGMAGDPPPYRLSSDNYVTGALLLSFFLVIYVIVRSSHIFMQQIKDFFYVNEHESLFGISTEMEQSGQLFLISQTCFILGILFFDYTQITMTDVANQVSPYKLLCLDIGILFVYFTVKVSLYSCINWVFFEKKKCKQWISSYFLIILGIGISLFPIALLVVYFDLSLPSVQISVIIVLIIANTLLFHKCYNIFFNYPYGYLHLILYFCTLEILPLLMLWRAMVYANKCLMVNF